MTSGSNAPAEQALKICALLPEVETALSTLQCAVAASRGFAAEICAVHVGFDARRAIVDAEELEVQQLRELYEGPPEARTARVKAVVDEFCAATPDAPAIYWRDDEGDVAAHVALEAYGVQLIVLSRPIHLDAADAFHSALFGAHRLILIAPRDVSAAERAIGRHIVVGWKPGRPVEATAEAAAPWLRRAEKVTVLWAQKAGVEPYDVSARAFFERLGVAVEIVRLQRFEHSVGLDLIAEAQRRGADSLLIGAYSHGAWWEAIFGGVTRDVLAHAEMPVFMMRAR